MLELKESSTINFRSIHDTWKLEELRVPGPGFTIRCFEYCAPHLYNSLPKFIRQLEIIETLHKSLITYVFSETFDFESNTFCDCFVT